MEKKKKDEGTFAHIAQQPDHPFTLLRTATSHGPTGSLLAAPAPPTLSSRAGAAQRRHRKVHGAAARARVSIRPRRPSPGGTTRPSPSTALSRPPPRPPPPRLPPPAPTPPLRSARHSPVCSRQRSRSLPHFSCLPAAVAVVPDRNLSCELVDVKISSRHGRRGRGAVCFKFPTAQQH
ncbi:Protein of unknown function [Gryllus bimaculatus]|nr:Protein of unknown function [Gryllus bimaculatus]